MTWPIGPGEIVDLLLLSPILLFISYFTYLFVRVGFSILMDGSIPPRSFSFFSIFGFVLPENDVPAPRISGLILIALSPIGIFLVLSFIYDILVH